MSDLEIGSFREVHKIHVLQEEKRQKREKVGVKLPKRHSFKTQKLT